MTSRTRPDPGHLIVETREDGPITRVILQGEADSTNVTDLENALAGIAPDDAHLIQLDVSGLTFIDVAALRRLTIFARQMKEAGRVIRTHDAQPILEHLVRLVGVDDDLGLA